MNHHPKKSKLSIKYKSLKKKGIFDMESPKNSSFSSQNKNNNKFNDLLRFFGMAFIIFIIFTVIGIFMGGKNLINKNKNNAFSGYDSLRVGIASLAKKDLDSAGQDFKNAQLYFEVIDKNLKNLTGQANDYLKTDLYLDASKKLITTGVSAAKIGQDLSALLTDIQNINKILIQQNLATNSKLKNIIKPTDFIKTQKKLLDSIMSESLNIQKSLATLNKKILPKDLTNSIVVVQQGVGDFIVILEDIDKNFQAILKLMGDKVPHRYLVILQNSNELRATGGFIGSYMLIDVNDGLITKMETKDVYETDGQLTDVIQPPDGIDQVNKRWYMRDANYSPDFPTSAKKIMWFLEHSKGPSVDTVIAIDQTVAEELLKLTGSITIKNFPFSINSHNFADSFSFHAEAKLSQTNTPKQLLIDFIPIFKEKLLGLKDLTKMIDVIKKLIISRNIQMYSTDQEVQKLIEKFNLDGKIVIPTDKVDFISVITTSIGGNKSDKFIKTSINHKTQVSQNGIITDNIIIKKTHTWQEKDFSNWDQLIKKYGAGQLTTHLLKSIQGMGDNLDYMRIYVPKGSKLINVKGINVADIKTYNDLGYTVLAFKFSPLKSGTSKTIDLTYSLPFKMQSIMDTYKFIIQKQAGAKNITLNKTLQVADELTILKTYPAPQNTNQPTMRNYETKLDTNKIFLSVIGEN